jgi:hypothetical protein
MRRTEGALARRSRPPWGTRTQGVRLDDTTRGAVRCVPGATADPKREFLDSISGTGRGSLASLRRRGEIEEKLCGLESSVASDGIDWSLLPGKWNVVYTTARDVRDIVKDEPLPFVKSTLVGQEFDEGHNCTNFIELKAMKDRAYPIISDLLDGSSITIRVRAKYQITGMKKRSIGLRFISAAAGSVEFQDDSPLKLLLLNAVFPPRGQWNLNVLNFLKDFEIKYEFISESEAERPTAIRPSLNVTYLGEDLLCGRAVDTGGLYIYRRIG